MERYLNFVFKFPLIILIALIGITGYFLMAIAGLSEDNNPYFLPDSHPARSTIYEIREDFTGTYDSVLVALYNEKGIFNRESINAIFELTEKFKLLSFVDESDVENLKSVKEKNQHIPQVVEAIDTILADGLAQNDGPIARKLYRESTNWGMDEADRKIIKILAERMDPVREMAGMAATENIFLDDDGTIIARKTVNNYDLDVAVVKEAMIENELMLNGSIDEKGQVALIVVELSLLSDDAYGQVRAYEAFKVLIAEYQQAHPELQDEIYIAGVPVFFAAQKNIIDHDFATLLPLVLVFIAVILAIFFRTVLGVVLPLLNVIMCTIWTLGMMAIAKIPMDIITAILPVFLITICSSDAIHVMAEYYHQKKTGKARIQAMRRAMILMISPIILTTLTTCLTFLVSTSTSIESLRNFGLLISFGMFVALIISLLLIPAVLALFKGKSTSENMSKLDDVELSKNYFISRVLLKSLRPVINNRVLYAGIFSVLFLAAFYSASKVSIDDMGSAYFSEKSEFRISDEFINGHIAGTSPGWIEIDSGEKNGAITTEMVNFVDKLEKFIHQLENVTFSYSVARYVRRINYTLNDFDTTYNRLPYDEEIFTDIDEDTGEKHTSKILGRDIVRQSILMYENGGGSDLTNVLNDDFSKTVILYTLNTTVASDYQLFLDSLNVWLTENTPDSYQVKLAGSPVIWTAVLDALVTSQTVSVLLAFVTVILVMGVWLRSARLGIAGTLPLVTTVVCFFALMTILGIELNIGTAIIAFLVLGIVDYSVHYILRIKMALESGLGINDALEAAMSVSGRAIMANVFVFSIGFIALLFSDFKPLVDLGTLVGLSLFISGIMSLFIVTLFAPWFFAEIIKKYADQHGLDKATVNAV